LGETLHGDLLGSVGRRPWQPIMAGDLGEGG
jgi:hypothetical protein